MDEQRLRLGNFSVSLTVKDIAASRAFYERLGFSVFHDAVEQGWMILRNEGATIGLFQGMFERNILTFNPGWDRDAQPLDDYTDVRDLQRELEAGSLELTMRADEGTTGPASCMVIDPDGNPILIDQHV
jgi:catechol 2,3-dioxygenase-like lactoylglutathione lyase family enzyme